MISLAHILRHPIKSIGYETLLYTPLTQGRVLPFDRHWAVAHEGAKFDGQPTQWVAKHNFLRGVAGPQLMAIKAALDPDTKQITLSHPNAPTVQLNPDDDPQALLNWLRPLWPDSRPAPSHVVSLPEGALTDVPDPFISLNSLSSLAALSAHAEQDLSIHRFRGNLWIDGWAPFEEFDLIGKTLRIGDAELCVEQRITRCRATTANPETGKTDVETLEALKTQYGHQDFGVYARVTKSGTLSLGDNIKVL